MGSVVAFPALDSMRQALPMMQGILLMAVYVMLPLILAFAAYEIKTVITLTFVIFATNFLTFWWELTRWVDSNMFTALYFSNTHSMVNLAGFQNTSDDSILTMVVGSMFLLLPAVWLGALSWAGVNIGNVIDSTVSGGGKQASNVTNTGTQMVMQNKGKIASEADNAMKMIKKS